MPHPDDERLGQLLRAIRRRNGLTQEALAIAAEIPRVDVIAIEAGRIGGIRIDRVRRAFGTAGGRLRLVPWWNGAAADRLLDERHAAIADRVVSLYVRWGWEIAVEVTFSEWGERGSIDILAAHAPTHAVVVNEVKASIGALEELNRGLDAKERLAPKLARERFGWNPASVSRLLIVPRDNSIRRHIERHAATMAAVYPSRSREVRRWLRQPDGPIRGIWFVSEVRDSDPVTG